MPDTSPIRAAMLDDHPLIISGIKNFLSHFERFQLLIEANSSTELFQQLAQQPIDLLLLDLFLEEKVNGLDVLREIRKDYPEIKVLIITLSNNFYRIDQALKLGAKGYVLKDSPPNLYQQAIETVMRGETYMSEKASQTWQDGMNPARNHPGKAGFSLTKSEKVVLKCLSLGFSMLQIGEARHRSALTVKTQKQSMMRKAKNFLGIQTIGALIAYAIEENLLEGIECPCQKS